MRDIAPELAVWQHEGRDYALATVVAVTGSAPRGVGAALAVAGDGTVLGSVSGGCVEGEVYELCREALRTGEPVLRSFDHDEEDPFAPGLSCGGSIEVFVQPVRLGHEVVHRLAVEAICAGAPVAVVRVVDGPTRLTGRTVLVGDGWHTGAFGDDLLDRRILGRARGLLEQGRTDIVRTHTAGDPERTCGDPVVVHVESYVPPPRMLVFGAVDFAAAVARIGAYLGYHVTVCDARATFATPQRFPAADEVVVDRPDRYLAETAVDSRTVVCVLTHDVKFDIPLLAVALRLPVAYVGAMGSRRTHRDRLRRLVEAGLGSAELARLHSPIGLDLGAETPEETAVAVAAEIIAARRGRPGTPLTATAGPIHGADAEPRPAERPVASESGLPSSR
ncbi:XdhC family protein [Embleya sp. NBC_00896]|uniref:XdhC family protein n=1 Tax=Embleya sp. NBC_00896 TaxID=2975961 RepID=UPI002F91ACB5|nr:XdhC family protein [Embleya sp. NBC_00896]